MYGVITNEEMLKIRQNDLITNPSARVAVCLVLDTSSSMRGKPIDELNKGVKLFIEAIQNDEIARYAAEVAIVTFGGVVNVHCDFQSIERLEFTDLTTQGSTPMEEAVLKAIDLLDKRKEEYVSKGVDYYQPWMVIMTDGYPDVEPKLSSEKTYQMAVNKKLSCFQIGIGEYADMKILAKFSPRTPLRLKGLNFEGFFEWLSKSIQVVSHSTVGDEIALDTTTISSWGTL